MPLTMTYGRPSPQSAVETVHAALDAGVTLFDTADMYGVGANERLLGRALGGHRDEVTIATKLGIVALPGVGIPVGLNARPERVRKCVEGSLRRLGTDRIDLLYLHRVDPSVPIEETIGAMAELVSEGSVRELGVCEVTAELLERANAVHRLAALQSEWSLFSRDVESGPLQAARRLGLAVVAYSPLGRGMLTGDPGSTTRLSLLDVRRFLPRWRGKNLQRNLDMVEVVRNVADAHSCTPAQVALAWLLNKGHDVVPIPGTSSPRHLRANLAALDVMLTKQDTARLDRLEAHGARARASDARSPCDAVGSQAIS
ncbi:aldo/keto reductase [Bifidobacterium tibiigranuli]|uniref:Aldo/keto reductase n=2 Tax=Bifidobacterium TaxID=1678 RepID=A0A5N6S5T0_9BIFI|nr:aldo/keto reductase [Bifidobacterium tibiigranuli]KAE8129051.1 aldo/keto reductase [Bifidobacterium tibiigranuli]